MLARGDLGIEIPATKIPLTQKEVCLVAEQNNKPVIIATQILTSMITSEVPTRAEMTDAIDGLLDGATYLMLSDETTIGAHPTSAVRILDECISEFTTNREKYRVFEH
jgi:pyruvate kinase